MDAFTHYHYFLGYSMTSLVFTVKRSIIPCMYVMFALHIMTIRTIYSNAYTSPGAPPSTGLIIMIPPRKSVASTPLLNQQMVVRISKPGCFIIDPWIPSIFPSLLSCIVQQYLNMVVVIRANEAIDIIEGSVHRVIYYAPAADVSTSGAHLNNEHRQVPYMLLRIYA